MTNTKSYYIKDTSDENEKSVSGIVQNGFEWANDFYFGSRVTDDGSQDIIEDVGLVATQSTEYWINMGYKHVTREECIELIDKVYGHVDFYCEEDHIFAPTEEEIDMEFQS